MPDTEKMAELLDWARENSRYGPLPTVVLPVALRDYASGLRAYGGKVVIAYEIDQPLIAFERNPVTPGAFSSTALVR